MAGTFTHWMIVEKALDLYDKLPQKHKYFPTILGNNQYINLGAVGPDYPYLTELIKNKIFKKHNWADRMHYENTGEFVKNGIANLLKLDGQNFEICLAWLCGYISHLLADSVIHPVVNAIVGPYIFNSDEHRRCEMIQDTFIFHEVKNVELTYADYVDIIQNCSDPDNKNCINLSIKNFWAQTLQMNYPEGRDKFNSIVPDEWHENFLLKIGLASDPIQIFRHMGEKENLVYKKSGDITDEERSKFIEGVRLPGDRTGNFKEDAFNKAVDKVIDVWNKIFMDIESKNPDHSMTYIRNWNLDTGVDEDVIYFWS